MLYDINSVIARKISKTEILLEKKTSVLLHLVVVFLACCGCCLGEVCTAVAVLIV